MITVKFTRNPDSSLWIGWAEYENGTYFASGRTMDKLVYRMKQALWSKKGVSFRQVYLDTKQSTIDDVPMDKMSRMFYTKHWSCGKDIVPPKTPTETKHNKPVPAYDYHEYKVVDGFLCVYGVKRDLITRYDLRKNQTEGGDNGGNE